MKFSFNLVDKAWIPVVIKGQFKEVSLQEYFDNLKSIERIISPVHGFEVSFRRMVLAICYVAMQGPTTKEALLEIRKNGFGNAITEYLNKYHDKFDLFSETNPFYQVAGTIVGLTYNPDGTLDKNNSPVLKEYLPSIRRLAFLQAHNPIMHNHDIDEEARVISFSEAAQILVNGQNFCPTCGICSQKLFGVAARKKKGNNSASQLAKALSFLNKGRNEFETLIFNMIPVNQTYISLPTGVPSWHRNLNITNQLADKDNLDTIDSICYLYTRIHQRIRLVPEIVDGEEVVRYADMFTNGPVSEIKDDPMLAYVKHTQGAYKGQIIPAKYNGAALWRRLSTFVDGENSLPAISRMVSDIFKYEKELKFHLFVCGFDADKSKINNTYTDEVPFSFDVFVDRANVVIYKTLVDHSDTVAFNLRNAFKAYKANSDSVKAKRRGGWSDEALLTFWLGIEQNLATFFDLVINKSYDDALNAWKVLNCKIAVEAMTNTLKKLEMKPERGLCLQRMKYDIKYFDIMNS